MQLAAETGRRRRSVVKCRLINEVLFVVCGVASRHRVVAAAAAAAIDEDYDDCMRSLIDSRRRATNVQLAELARTIASRRLLTTIQLRGIAHSFSVLYISKQELKDNVKNIKISQHHRMHVTIDADYSHILT